MIIVKLISNFSKIPTKKTCIMILIFKHDLNNIKDNLSLKNVSKQTGE